MSTIIAEILNRIPPMTQELSYIFWIGIFILIFIGGIMYICELWRFKPPPPSTVNNYQIKNNVTIIVPPSP